MPNKILATVLLAFLLILPAQAARVSLPNGELTDSHTDLSVKVLGGSVSVQRTWTNGRWYINPSWADLKFKINSSDNSVAYVDRAGTVYEQTGNQSDIYLFDDDQFIRRIETGTAPNTTVTWRWYDRMGSSINYDSEGRMTGYANRNGVKVSFIRNGAGRISQVNDHFNNLALSFTYTGDNLTSVKDRVNREVRYTWTGELLTQVNDVLTYPWVYTYNTDGQLTSVKDPENHTTSVTYVTSYRVGAIAAPQGLSFSGRPGRDFRISRVATFKNAKNEVTKYDYEFRRGNQEFVVIETTPEPFRRRIERAYDMQGRLLKEENGDRREFERRRDGLLIDYVKNERGLITRTERDAYRNVLNVTYADGAINRWKYHPVFNFVTEATDALGRKTLYEYADNGNLMKVREAVGSPVERSRVYTYDYYGQLKTYTMKGATPAEDATTQYFYDDYGNVTRMLDPLLQESKILSHNVMGRAVEREDSRGHLSKATYNDGGWVLKTETALSFIISVAYDKVGNRTKTQRPIDGNQTADTTFRYDALDRLIEIEDPLGGISRYSYDEEGRIRESFDARNVRSLMEYDGTARMIKVTDGNSNVTETVYGDKSNALEGLVAGKIFPTYREEYRYDERDRQTEVRQILSPTLNYTSYIAYDAVGNVVSQIDAKNRTNQHSYDELNRLTQEIDPILGKTSYTYDQRDNLLTLTDANGNTHRFTYDKCDRQLTEQRPMGQTIAYQYDRNGNLIERISPNGAKRKFRYDDDDRLEKEEHFLPNQSAASKIQTYTYDQRGLLKTYDDGLTSGLYIYDMKGQKVSETVTFGKGSEAFSKTLSRSYEANGLHKSLAYPGTTGTLSFTYDNNNQLKTYKIPGLAQNNDTLTYNYQWNAIQEVTMPGLLKRNVTLDALQRPERIEVKGYGPTPGNNGVPVMDHSYIYDAVSNIVKKTTIDGDYIYEYDRLNRITKVLPPPSLMQGPSNPAGLPSEGYSYDGVSNRISGADGLSQFNYNANNELNEWVGYSRYSYDSNGSTIKEQSDILTRPVREYSYDAQDRLWEVKEDSIGLVEYAYDPSGRRVWRKSYALTGNDITWFFYSDEGLIGEYSSSALPLREYGWPAGGRFEIGLIWQAEGGAKYLIHEDEIFAAAAVTSAANGQVELVLRRDSFGDFTGFSGSNIHFSFRLPGQYEDLGTGLYQNYFRDYDSKTGRYLQADPTGLEGGINLFAYALQGPTYWIDPTGLRGSPPMPLTTVFPVRERPNSPSRPSPGGVSPYDNRGPVLRGDDPVSQEEPELITSDDPLDTGLKNEGSFCPKPENCDSPGFSDLQKCKELELYGYKNSTDFEVYLKRKYGPYSYGPDKPMTERGTCNPKNGRHTGIRVFGQNVGSIIKCACCEMGFKTFKTFGPKRKYRFKAV